MADATGAEIAAYNAILANDAVTAFEEAVLLLRDIESFVLREVSLDDPKAEEIATRISTFLDKHAV